ncbi:hypothetical protein BGX34_009882 [Mortierella sp. NVP85]|nr:hypothetical protein BGX34_009882 [Mortierella sp. NVP85]
MGYDYVLPIFILILTAGAFYAFSGDRISRVASSSKASLPGAFSDSTIKAKKKKPKKKSASHKSGSTVTESVETEEGRDESEDDTKASVKLTRDRKVTSAAEAKAGKKKVSPSSVSVKSNDTNSEKGSTTTSLAVSASSASEVTHSNNNNIININSNNNSNNNSKTGKPSSVENWKAAKQGEKKEQLAKQQENLQFAAAARSTTPSSIDSSLHIASIPGPGALGKKGRNNTGSGLSHTDFPVLARPQPTSSAVPRQPKPSKQEKEVLKKPSFEPVDEPEGSIQFVGDDSDEEGDGDDEEREEEEKAHRDSDNDDDDDETKVLSTESRSSGIDFNKPMDPWVAQQQRQRLERIATADPHGEQTEKFARVLTIKPVVKDERIFEPIPDGFAVQKSRAGGGSSGGSGHQPTELTKKQRENMARAAKKKEEKAALDALQEQRRKDHMKQVKGERMNEFYRAQARKQAPESRWNTPKSTAPASSSPSPAPTSLIWD